MMRKFALGLIGAAMIALPATLASAQGATPGNSCAPGSKAAACATNSAPQAKQQAKAPGKSVEPKAQQGTKAQQGAKAQPAPTAMKKGQKFGNAGEKLPDPKAYGLKEQRGASYYKKDGQVYRIDDQTREILAVVGAVADLLN